MIHHPRLPTILVKAWLEHAGDCCAADSDTFKGDFTLTNYRGVGRRPAPSHFPPAGSESRPCATPAAS
jgi:hypothetical protein